ncbi:L-rhamnose mutarotase [Saccharospirillum sp. MSK14-1]|uniref:L-rhamnose mutarotase n=1 Tax=Saccharospirillum sp. MSK14-1 TaxID=1897632 RepID=UPI000D388CE6|nr:L-rhamnose mutarotase [Saccharospirillum sp. MSK14-1]PTY35763.1 L-rhamnose mutarotase [Saccharospirillum sp. MSK14-1]
MIHASVMQLYPGYEEEYRKRHDALWPELEAHLKDCGIRNYHIFLHPQTLQLFACFETDDGIDEATLKSHPIMQRWWTYMADIMETNHDSPEPKATPLTEVFYLP